MSMHQGAVFGVVSTIAVEARFGFLHVLAAEVLIERGDTAESSDKGMLHVAVTTVRKLRRARVRS